MRAVTAAALAAVVLVCVHLAAGGGDFEVASPPEPCAHRPAPRQAGPLESAERLGLAALASAACDLGVTRERLLLSLTHDRALPDGITTADAAQAFRAGLATAIEEERAAGRLGEAQALILSRAVELLPVEQLLERFFGG